MLRSFLVVAEELHFSRAAGRLFVAQQALSREISRLEDRIGKPLFTRTTRQVTLTAAGAELLTYAQQLVALHDKALHALRGEPAPLVIDVVGGGLTPGLVIADARERVRGVEFFAQERHGPGDPASAVRTNEVDVAFGRWTVAGARAAGLRHRLVRLEPLVVLVPDGHPLAGRPRSRSRACAAVGSAFVPARRSPRTGTTPSTSCSARWASTRQMPTRGCTAPTSWPTTSGCGMRRSSC